jgi:4-hydroxy-3-polyprenylbenzoate decarboxylase
MHSTSEVLCRLGANTDPQDDSIFTKGAPDVIGHPARELLIVGRLGMDATKNELHEGFKLPRSLLVRIDATMKAKLEMHFHPWQR